MITPDIILEFIVIIDKKVKSFKLYTHDEVLHIVDISKLVSYINSKYHTSILDIIEELLIKNTFFEDNVLIVIDENLINFALDKNISLICNNFKKIFSTKYKFLGNSAGQIYGDRKAYD